MTRMDQVREAVSVLWQALVLVVRNWRGLVVPGGVFVTVALVGMLLLEHFVAPQSFSNPAGLRFNWDSTHPTPGTAVMFQLYPGVPALLLIPVWVAGWRAAVGIEAPFPDNLTGRWAANLIKLALLVLLVGLITGLIAAFFQALLWGGAWLTSAGLPGLASTLGQAEHSTALARAINEWRDSAGVKETAEWLAWPFSLWIASRYHLVLPAMMHGEHAPVMAAVQARRSQQTLVFALYLVWALADSILIEILPGIDTLGPVTMIGAVAAMAAFTALLLAVTAAASTIAWQLLRESGGLSEAEAEQVLALWRAEGRLLDADGNPVMR